MPTSRLNNQTVSVLKQELERLCQEKIDIEENITLVKKLLGKEPPSVEGPVSKPRKGKKRLSTGKDSLHKRVAAVFQKNGNLELSVSEIQEALHQDGGKPVSRPGLYNFLSNEKATFVSTESRKRKMSKQAYAALGAP